jgi:hypothetical protein
VNLDCETSELAEQSLATILRMDVTRLGNRIREIKKTDFEINTSTEDDRWLPMLNAVAGRKITDSDGGQTCWFHASRIKDFSSFRQGILPLPRNVNRIWNMLYPLVADRVTLEEWKEFRRETVADNYGGHSAMVVNAWMANEGPYAFLFTESAMSPKDSGNHDYFASSELIEWIASCFERKFRVSLHDRHHAATQPALIKFWTPGIKAVHLGATVDYLLHRHLGWSISNVDPCFSADGEQITPAQVIKAIPILEHIRRFGKHLVYSVSPVEAHVLLRD